MILQLPDILRRVVPELVGTGPLSTVRIHTTRPVYLVFRDEEDKPGEPKAVCTVQFGPAKEMLRLRAALRPLHAFLPETVPDALGCSPVDGDTFVLVQQAMPGVAWFRVRDRISDLGAWIVFRKHARHTLTRLHDAIRRRHEWCLDVHVGRELADCSIAAARKGLLSRDLCGRLEKTAADVSSGTVDWFFQHGDYCVNNLLLAGSQLAVIDFEEFGQTAMPLHDEFSLALSFHEFMAGIGGAPTFEEHLGACIGPTLALCPEIRGLLQPLFLHHLVWRIYQCGARPARAAIREHLVGLLDQAVRASEFSYSASRPQVALCLG